MSNANMTLVNWDEIFYAAIHREGFQSASDLLYTFPACPYESIVEKLGFNPTEDIVQCIEILHYKEAISQKRQNYAIMDVLVRYINRDQVCWDNKFKNINKRVGKTYYGWYSFIDSCMEYASPDARGQKAKQVWDTLEILTAGHPDWCPKSVDDPLIVKAFENIDWCNLCPHPEDKKSDSGNEINVEN